MSHTIYLALGTNLGDRRKNLQSAIIHLPASIQVTAASPVYQTPPWGVEQQPDFLNQVLCVRTDLTPTGLLAVLKNLEVELGRTPGPRYGPRLIDLDILFYDDLCRSEPGLEIPHPRLEERAFVLVPLADLAPDLVHPGTGKTVAQMLDRVDSSVITLYMET